LTGSKLLACAGAVGSTDVRILRASAKMRRTICRTLARLKVRVGNRCFGERELATDRLRKVAKERSGHLSPGLDPKTGAVAAWDLRRVR
jgi:hypothetical protein